MKKKILSMVMILLVVLSISSTFAPKAKAVTMSNGPDQIVYYFDSNNGDPNLGYNGNGPWGVSLDTLPEHNGYHLPAKEGYIAYEDEYDPFEGEKEYGFGYYINSQWPDKAHWNWDGTYVGDGSGLPPGVEWHAGIGTRNPNALKVLIYAPWSGKSCVAIIGDSGPAPWTGRQFGVSNKVFDALGLPESYTRPDGKTFSRGNPNPGHAPDKNTNPTDYPVIKYTNNPYWVGVSWASDDAIPGPVTLPFGPEVVCVPWRGDEDLPHPTYDGKEVTLKGTVRYEGQVSWEWDFGDGTSQTGTATTTDVYPFPISVKHTYSGSVGTVYVAKLTVTAGGETKSDTYLVRIEDKTRKVEADVAVDEGLWWLYQQQNRYTSDGIDFGYWYTSYTVAHTGATVQAFENNLHKPFGDPTKDPYVDCVRRGLNYLTLQMYKVNIPADDGDTNGNGFGLTCHHPGYSGHEMYEIGIAMMAIVSSDTPGRVAVAGPDGVIGRTYREIVQDMADFCAYAQNGPETGFYEGGWRYRRNYGNSDNSVTQWPIMGMEPAEAKPEWEITIADFVKPRLEGWLNRMQCKVADWRFGGFGYTSSDSWVNIAKTAGTGIPGFLFCGVPDTDPRVVNAINFIDTNWASDNFGNGYAMYGVMKAFEEFLHRESTGSHIWWNEYVDYLIPLQRVDGHWDTMAWSCSPQLTTAWMVMILTKVVYDIPPTAVAKANGFDEVEVDKDQIVNFDGSQSREGTYKIVKYEWDWESDGVYDAEGITASHSYAEYGTYTVTLRVTDNRDVVTGGKKPAMSDTDTCIVYVHPPPHPPIADANGPYIGWVGVPVTLDGSGSWDPNEPPFGDDEIISWNWDLDNDGEFDDASGEIVEFTWDNPGTYPIALWVSAKEEPRDCEEPSRTIVEIGNHDPVADANGPYETWICHTITLDGSGSYDPDEPAGDRIVSYEWDLDNDGEYDDAFVVNPEFHKDTEGVYTVRLRVTDSFGATGTDWTTVVITPVYPWGDEGYPSDPDGILNFLESIALSPYNIRSLGYFSNIGFSLGTYDVKVGGGYCGFVDPFGTYDEITAWANAHVTATESPFWAAEVGNIVGILFLEISKDLLIALPSVIPKVGLLISALATFGPECADEIVRFALLVNAPDPTDISTILGVTGIASPAFVSSFLDIWFLDDEPTLPNGFKFTRIPELTLDNFVDALGNVVFGALLGKIAGMLTGVMDIAKTVPELITQFFADIIWANLYERFIRPGVEFIEIQGRRFYNYIATRIDSAFRDIDLQLYIDGNLILGDSILTSEFGFYSGDTISSEYMLINATDLASHRIILVINGTEAEMFGEEYNISIRVMQNGSLLNEQNFTGTIDPGEIFVSSIDVSIGPLGELIATMSPPLLSDRSILVDKTFKLDKVSRRRRGAVMSWTYINNTGYLSLSEITFNDTILDGWTTKDLDRTISVTLFIDGAKYQIPYDELDYVAIEDGKYIVYINFTAGVNLYQFNATSGMEEYRMTIYAFEPGWVLEIKYPMFPPTDLLARDYEATVSVTVVSAEDITVTVDDTATLHVK